MNSNVCELYLNQLFFSLRYLCFIQVEGVLFCFCLRVCFSRPDTLDLIQHRIPNQMLFLALSGPAIFSLFQSSHLADIACGIKKSPMSYRLSSEILLVSSLVWHLWSYLVMVHIKIWLHLPATFCPLHRLLEKKFISQPWPMTIWWRFFFFFNQSQTNFGSPFSSTIKGKRDLG